MAGKRVIVTGAKGGTGRSIVTVLRDAGWDVTGVDLAMPGHTDGGYRRADVLDAASLNDLFAGVDGVVHFGSVPTDNFTSWTECFRNVMEGGFNVLQACANAGVPRLVFASSMEVYGDLTQQPRLPITESSPLQASSIYGAAKRLLESLAADYARWHGMAIAGLRLGRIVYEGSWDWRLKRHTESRDACVDCLWNYVDARDVARACQMWLESDLSGFRAWNLAADDVCLDAPVDELLAEFYPGVPLDGELGQFQSPFLSTAIQQELGWQAQIGWRDIRDEAAKAGA